MLTQAGVKHQSSGSARNSRCSFLIALLDTGKWPNFFIQGVFFSLVQSGRSSLAKHGGAYFSAVYGFMKDPIAAPGPYENQEC